MNHTSNNDETSAQTETGVSTGFRRDWKDTRYLHGKSLSFRDEQKGYIELNVKCGKSERGPINSNNLERIFKNEFRPDFMDNVKYKSSQLSDTAAGSKKADTAAEDETLVSTPALREAIFQDAGSRTDSEISA
ncbi:hypothetical protein I302_101391 [Kwoniella bestiolae CBS 10118]|uniref:Uncharacterized protein n=1 Tax=Kwoniella bestiolae CBS 10118 TaxID=1296100 RepID=A0A1B9GC34_9TREE|nr:hypothetical protein I302_00074 [Kwoniella bestiolae CBS 10118]OCF28586.1 hypothetical protein I302_00074 [Kwoniella bestiolae CBS 10118]